MLSLKEMAMVLDSLPDLAFIFSRSGQYMAIYGGRDTRYYHDGCSVVGSFISDLIKPEKANWFLQQINNALDSRKLLIIEYELSNRDITDFPDDDPSDARWFEGRIQVLDFQVNNEDVVLWVESNMSARHELEVKLKELSDTDQLSGLYNRRRLERELSNHFELFTRYGTESSLLIFDLDNLKPINDSQGHHRGDQLIKAAADVCKQQLRQNDIACRFGGDEFVIALPNTGLSQAWQCAQRLHELLSMALQDFSVAGISASVSMGVATMSAGDHSFSDALMRADNALYKAKRAGKNQVVSAYESTDDHI